MAGACSQRRGDILASAMSRPSTMPLDSAASVTSSVTSTPDSRKPRLRQTTSNSNL